MYYQVLEQSKGQDQSKQPSVYIVEDVELMHFIHDNLRSDNVLIFSEFPARNLYTESNIQD